MITLTVYPSQQVGGPKADLRIKHLTSDEADVRLKRQFKQFTDRVDHLEKEDTGTEYARYGGVECRIVYSKVDEYLTIKKKILKKALEQIENHDFFKLPQNKLEVYCINKKYSVGYVFSRPNKQDKIAALILGESAYKTQTKLVADSVYDYYKPTFKVNAREARVLTACFHEFGHVFHQLHAPSQYFAAADLGILYGKSRGEIQSDEYSDKYASFPRRPSKQKMTDFFKAVGNYGRMVSPYASTHPNEFVAEVFSGMMMGVPFEDKVRTVYLTVGGPVPDAGMAHIRSGRGPVKKVLYKLSRPIFSIGDGT